MRRWIAVAALVGLLVGASAGVAGASGSVNKGLDALEYTTYLTLTRPVQPALKRMGDALATVRTAKGFAAAAGPAERTLLRVVGELRHRGTWPGPAHGAVVQTEQVGVALAHSLRAVTPGKGAVNRRAMNAVVREGREWGAAMGTVEADLLIPFLPSPKRP